MIYCLGQYLALKSISALALGLALFGASDGRVGEEKSKQRNQKGSVAMPEGDNTMGDITLAASTRNSLLSVKDTMGKMAVTQRRLESGKAVDSAVDDAVKYFKAKGLTDRAQDYTDLKANIEQNISMIKAGVDGLSAIEKIYKQIKGLVQKAKQDPIGQIKGDDLSIQDGSQWNTFFNKDTRSFAKQAADLLTQIDYLAEDSSYQGQTIIRPDPFFHGETISVLSGIDTNTPADIANAKIANAQYPDEPHISLEGKRPIISNKCIRSKHYRMEF